MDRLTVAGSNAFQSSKGFDYLENHCVDEPVKLCEFKKLSGRILKTVDSVYQDVGSTEECRELCLNSPFRCHSYDYGDTGDMVCRLSHHSRATLSDIQVSDFITRDIPLTSFISEWNSDQVFFFLQKVKYYWKYILRILFSLREIMTDNDLWSLRSRWRMRRREKLMQIIS